MCLLTEPWLYTTLSLQNNTTNHANWTEKDPAKCIPIQYGKTNDCRCYISCFSPYILHYITAKQRREESGWTDPLQGSYTSAPAARFSIGSNKDTMSWSETVKRRGRRRPSVRNTTISKVASLWVYRKRQHGRFWVCQEQQLHRPRGKERELLLWHGEALPCHGKSRIREAKMQHSLSLCGFPLSTRRLGGVLRSHTSLTLVARFQ